MKRKIIKISEEKCNGCSLCIPNCPEGALQIIDGKARLVSDLFCDGLGACVGHCPQGAIEIEEREAEAYDEKKVMENIVKQGENTIKAHLKHLKEHGQIEYLNQAKEFLKEKNIEIDFKEKQFSCPGCMEIKPNENSELSQWPIQLSLVNPEAPYFQNKKLLICADCVAFAYKNFHDDFLKEKSLVIGCPKLDDKEFYKEKLKEIFLKNNIKEVNILIMEVPCCFGLKIIVEEAVKESGRKIELKAEVIKINGK